MDFLRKICNCCSNVQIASCCHKSGISFFSSVPPLHSILFAPILLVTALASSDSIICKSYHFWLYHIMKSKLWVAEYMEAGCFLIYYS